MTKLVTLAVTSLVLLAALPLGWQSIEASLNKTQAHAKIKISKEARELHANLFVADMHADSLLWNRDLLERGEQGHLDVPRMIEGNMALQMLTTVTKSPKGQNLQTNNSKSTDRITSLVMLQAWPPSTWFSLTERAVYQAQKLHDFANISDELMLITSQSDLQRLVRQRGTTKVVGALLGTEGSHALEANLNNIDRLYKEGFRMMSLQHFFDNELGGSLHGVEKGGLTEFGRNAVRLMQAKSIIVDLAHSSEKVVKDVLAIAQSPVIISHTGFKGHCDSPRNINDALMQDIAAAGGLIAVGFWQSAVCSTHPKSVVEALVYGINLVGEDHVVLGSDFDGSVTTGFDVSQMSVLTELLLQKGIEPRQIRKVMGENVLNFFRQHLPTK